MSENICEASVNFCIICSFGDTLGHGHFGTVCEGTLSTHVGNIQVAVKMMRKDASAEEKIALLQEAAIMGQFRHPCVIWLFGIITVGEPVSKPSVSINSD